MATTSKYKVKAGKDYDYEIEVNVPVAEYEEFREQVYKKLAGDVKIAGFRPGKAPRPQIEAKLGNDLMNETVNLMLPNIAADIVEIEKLNPITQLSYDLTKLSNTEVEFTFSFTNYPTVKLGDLTKIKVEHPHANVEEKDIDEVVMSFFTKEGEAPSVDLAKIDDKMVADLKLPDITTLAQLREYISGKLFEMKAGDAEAEFERLVLDDAIAKSEIPIPGKLLDSQTGSLVEGYISRIRELKLEPEVFLQAQGTTLEKLTEQKRAEAKQKIAADLLLNEIVKTYDLFPSSGDVEAELKSIKDPEIKASYDSVGGRRYILSVLIQQRGLRKLSEIAHETIHGGHDHDHSADLPTGQAGKEPKADKPKAKKSKK